MSDTSWYAGHLNGEAVTQNIADFIDTVDTRIDAGELSPCIGGKWYVVISGSGVFLSCGVSRRFLTDDIDICAHETYSEIIDMLADFDMNTAQMRFPSCFPSDYQQRWAIFYEGIYIDAYMPSWSDLVFSKLGRNKIQDEKDMEGLIDHGMMDWHEVESLIQQEEAGSDFPAGIMEKIRLHWNQLLEKHQDKHDLIIDWGDADPYDGWDD